MNRMNDQKNPVVALYMARKELHKEEMRQKDLKANKEYKRINRRIPKELNAAERIAQAIAQEAQTRRNIEALGDAE